MQLSPWKVHFSPCVTLLVWEAFSRIEVRKGMKKVFWLCIKFPSTESVSGLDKTGCFYKNMFLGMSRNYRNSTGVLQSVDFFFMGSCDWNHQQHTKKLLNIAVVIYCAHFQPKSQSKAKFHVEKKIFIWRRKRLLLLFYGFSHLARLSSTQQRSRKTQEKKKWSKMCEVWVVKLQYHMVAPYRMK